MWHRLLSLPSPPLADQGQLLRSAALPLCLLESCRGGREGCRSSTSRGSVPQARKGQSPPVLPPGLPEPRVCWQPGAGGCRRPWLLGRSRSLLWDVTDTPRGRDQPGFRRAGEAPRAAGIPLPWLCSCTGAGSRVQSWELSGAAASSCGSPVSTPCSTARLKAADKGRVL